MKENKTVIIFIDYTNLRLVVLVVSRSMQCYLNIILSFKDKICLFYFIGGNRNSLWNILKNDNVTLRGKYSFIQPAQSQTFFSYDHNTLPT